MRVPVLSGSITFDEHLKGVQSVLRCWGSDLALCDAGLFHSIYGTEGFQGYKLPFSRRQDIRNVRTLSMTVTVTVSITVTFTIMIMIITVTSFQFS